MIALSFAHFRPQVLALARSQVLPDEAEKTFRDLVAAFPDSLSSRESLAAFLYEQEKKDEALTIWRKLADGKERSEVVRIARTLAVRNEHQAAFGLLEARYGDFSSDLIFLGQLVAEATAVDEYKKALPWVRRRVRLSRTAHDLDTAVNQAARVIAKAEATDDTIKSLENTERRSVGRFSSLACWRNFTKGLASRLVRTRCCLVNSPIHSSSDNRYGCRHSDRIGQKLPKQLAG